MFVLLSKTLDLLLAPLSWGLLLLAASLLARKRPRLRATLAGTALAVLYLFSIDPVAGRLMRWVEADAVSTQRKDVVYDAVIVLGGGLDPAGSARTGQKEFNAGAERLLMGFSLLRQDRAKNVLLSAGNLFPTAELPAEAELLAAQLRDWGIAPERIVQEGKSRNTYENAVESAAIVKAKGWKTLLLVTSAAHMPRAAGCFRAQGLEVDVLPVDHRAWGAIPFGLLPRAGALSASSDALRELAGRVIYRVRGYSR